MSTFPQKPQSGFASLSESTHPFVRPGDDRNTPIHSRPFVRPGDDRNTPIHNRPFVRPGDDRNTPIHSSPFIKPEYDRNPASQQRTEIEKEILACKKQLS